MNRIVLRGMFLVTLLTTSLWLTSSLAFAAQTQAHHTKVANTVSAQNDCTPHNTGVMVIATDEGYDVDCFYGNGSMSVGLYSVTALETGNYDLSFTWKDYNGGIHNSFKSHGSFLSAGNANGTSYFAGYGDMAEITSISLTLNMSPTADAESCSSPSGGVWIATNIDGSGKWYADCFTKGGTQPVGLYGVYAIETGGWNIIYNWIDYNGDTGQGAAGFWSLVTPGTATSLDGFSGNLKIAKITSITLYQG